MTDTDKVMGLVILDTLRRDQIEDSEQLERRPR